MDPPEEPHSKISLRRDDRVTDSPAMLHDLPSSTVSDDRFFHVVAPVAGTWTSVVFVVLVGVAAIWGGFVGGDQPTNVDLERQKTIFAGLAYGLFSGIVWWSSFVQTRWARWTFVGVCGAALVIWLSFHQNRPFVRYVSFFAGLAIFQSILFWLARVPSWVRVSRQNTDGPAGKRVGSRQRQFSMIDLVAMTGAVALLISAGQHYQADYPLDVDQQAKVADPARSALWWSYWKGFPMVWAWLPLLSLAIAILACCRRWWVGVMSLVVSLLVAGLGAFAMADLQVKSGELPRTELARVFDVYWTFAVLYAFLFGGLALAGRYDSLWNRFGRNNSPVVSPREPRQT